MNAAKRHEITVMVMTEVPELIGNLDCLNSLRLCGFAQLKLLPGSTGRLTGLEELTIEHCGSLEELPPLAPFWPRLTEFWSNWTR